jgi:voltage-gated potassium channel
MSNRLARILDTAALVGALATIPLTVLGEENPTTSWVRVADWVVWAIFLLEYTATVAIGPDRTLYVKRHPLNLAVVILSYPHLPTILGLVRLARLARYLRLLRLVGVTARAVEALRTIFWRRGMVCVAFISGFVILAGGTGLRLIEPQTVRGGFADGIWWAIVTASTIGYGDIAPSTIWGRVIAVLLMLSGIGLISTLAASITAYFLGQEDDAALTEIRERTARIEELLNALLTDRVKEQRNISFAIAEVAPPENENVKSAAAGAEKG